MALRRRNDKAFEHLMDQMAIAMVRCSDDQLLDLADSLHAMLRRRRDAKCAARLAGELRSVTG
jgi:hypothetical protein